jgi:hypothetical protein
MFTSWARKHINTATTMRKGRVKTLKHRYPLSLHRSKATDKGYRGDHKEEGTEMTLGCVT